MMDRNREPRRSANMLASSNGLSRRRHRTNSLIDSPDEDGLVELQETVRLRERVKKDRDRDRDRERDREREREREKERERERSSTIRSSKRRRGERMMIHGNNRGDDGGEDTSEESVNDDEEDDYEENHNHHHHHQNSGGGPIGGVGGVRLPPNPNSSATPAVSAVSNHYHNGNSNNNNSYYSNSNITNNTNHQLQQHQNLQVRKSYPQSAAKVFRAAPVWKSGDEMIGVSVPRKARSASTKRSHDLVSNSTTGGVGVGGGEQVNQQASTSPARPPLPAAPLSPSSSNASAKKKIKPNGSKQQSKPPKSAQKTSSLNPEELEIEIAEVLFGLKTQSQAPLKKEFVSNDAIEVNRSSSDAKSRVSSPISNSPTPNLQSSPAVLPPNSCSSVGSLTVVAPKRKKPRQVTENQGSFSVKMKVEADQMPKAEIFSPSMEKSVENGYEIGSIVNSDVLPPEQRLPEPMREDLESKPAAEGLGESPDVICKKEVVSSPKKESPAEEAEESCVENVGVKATALGSVTKGNSDAASLREEKFQIDLEASPPGLRSSPERGEINMTVAASEHKQVVSDVDAEMKPLLAKDKEDDKVLKLGKIDVPDADGGVDKKLKLGGEESEVLKEVDNKERNVDVHLDLEKPELDNGSISKFTHQSQKQQQLPRSKSTKEEPQVEKTGQSSSVPLPMSMAGWPGGLPPMGYMAPIQGVVTMDGSTVSTAPVQPLFTLPRPKRCATHCYIARNIDYLQKFMKINPFWQAAAGSASLFGSKPCNLGVVPQTDLHGSITGRVANNAQDKAPGLTIFPSHCGKDKASQTVNVVDAGQRKQQILLQQTLPHVPPNNMLHGPAFIFPLNQQQAAVAAAAARPGMAKPATTSGSLASSSTPNVAATSASATAGGAATAVSFSYPSMPANETQYLAILQNNYPFPIPAAMGAPPNYRGTHPQPLPLFNGSFYSSPIIHLSQLQQSQQSMAQSHQIQQSHQNSSMPSSSSSSQKHMQGQQQRPAGTSIPAGNGGGNLQNFPAAKNRQLQQSQQQLSQQITSSARQLENEAVAEDSTSTADSRGTRAPLNIYGQNFAMPVHPQNYALLAAPAALASASATSSGSNQNEKKPPQPQQQAVKAAMESLPQTFAMSFASINGANSTSGIDLSSMAQNHAILQSLPEVARHNFQMMAANAAQVAQAPHRKNLKISDDGKTGGTDSPVTDDERKGVAGKSPVTVGQQSIAFSRSELSDASVSAAVANNVIDSSSRSLNLASGPVWPARTTLPSAMGAASISNAQLQAQHQPQQMMQLHKQQQQQLTPPNAARSKNHLTSNVSVYPEHLSSTMTSAAAKFPNALSSFPQGLVQTSNSGGQSQSPQWKNSVRTSTSQSPSSFVSSTSGLKNLPQQQGRMQQTHTQISFGSNNQKSAAGPQGQPPPPSSSQSPSSPMMVGSPSASSMSKGASGSPRTTSASAQLAKNSSVPGQTISSAQVSSLSAQHAKNSSLQGQKSSPVGGRNVSSILGNPHVSSTSSSGAKPQLQQQQQQQLPKNLQQAQLFFSNPYLQSQSPHTSSTNLNPSAAGGYYMQRRRPDQQQQVQPQQQLGVASASSTGMLTLCPVSLASGGTTDPAKAIAAATVAASTMKGGNLPSHGILNAPQFTSQSAGSPHQMSPAAFSYVHSVPATVQVKPAEQKQPAGNDNLHASWQPEKK